MNKKINRIIIILFFLAGIIGFASQAQAVNCGDTDSDGVTDTVCNCGDTVVGAVGYTYQLAGDLTCTGHGLIVGADGITIDGDGYTITGDDGASDYGIDNSGGYSNVTIQNFGTSADSGISNFFHGIYVNNSTDSIIQDNIVNSNTNHGIRLSSSVSCVLTNNTVNSNSRGISLTSSVSCVLVNNTTNFNNYGIILTSSESSTLIGNTANLNSYAGIFLSSSGSSILTSNTANSNAGYGIQLFSSASSALTENTMLMNINDFSDDQAINNTYQNNQFLHNSTNTVLSFVETSVPGIKNINDTISFIVTAKEPDGTDCVDCTVITTSPSELSLSYSDNGSGVVTGNFIPTRTGTYSLDIRVTDDNGNIAKRNYSFFVGAIDTQTTTYYFRGIKPTHGQPAGTDARSLLLTASINTEIWACSSWVLNSIDEIPDYPLAYLSSIDSYTWYKQTAASGAYIGAQRYVTYDPIVDVNSSVAAVADYTWINKNFTGLNWAIDYPWSWYWLSLKLRGIGGSPCWTTFPEGETDKSYADFTYQYTTTPAIKSISDENIMVLSATADPSDTCIISIVLEDSLTSDTSTMDIVLSSPVRIDISIDEWNTTALYYKQWEEEASEPGITATHTISGFAPNNYYSVTKDGALVGLYISDNLGKLTFTCLAGSVFSVVGLDTIFQTDRDDDDADYRCFLTTLFAKAMADEDRVLCKFREFRDSYLLTNPVGEGFVATYYKVSPHAALFIKEHPVLKKTVRSVLNPLIWMSEKSIK